MRPKSMVLIVIALACGLVASIGISQVMENRSSEPVIVETVEILVAKTEIKVGDNIEEDTVSVEEWPKDKAPLGVLASLEDVKGRRPRQQIFQGEPIIEGKLISEDHIDKEASERIRKGYRAFAIKVQEDSAVAHLLKPGDTVDVLVFLKKSESVPQTMMKTIMQNVRVFAVNDHMDRIIDETGKSIKAKTVTLEIKPEQVELISLADSIGRIRLSCRRADDDSSESTRGASPNDVFSGDRGVLTENDYIPLPDWMAGLGPQPDNQPELSKETSEDSPQEELPRMEILEPDGSRFFEFPAEGTPPREVTLERTVSPLPGIMSGDGEEDHVKDETQSFRDHLNDGIPQDIEI